MDSGAYSLYNIHVRKFGEVMGKHGKPLDRGHVLRGQGDFSFYSLEKGSEFRKYCDKLASFIKRVEGTGVLTTTVDVITNPEKTWEVQQYFEKEHGVFPVPVLHYGTPLKWLDKYLETGKYDLIGLGGLGQHVKPHHYPKWADQVFVRICPESNGYVPIVKTHGFAMTSWTLMRRWPWWSVDSATWIKLAAYGWIIVPKWVEGKGFQYDSPPLQINVSRKGGSAKWKFWWRVGIKTPSQIKDRHIDNAKLFLKENVERWLEHIKLPMGSYKANGTDIDIEGVASHFKSRAVANLIYLKHFEQSRPEWPYPLDPAVVSMHRSAYRKGFGLT